MPQIGEPITKEQKDLLNRLLTTQDLIDVSTTVDASYSTVKSLFYRTASVTEENQQAVYKMISRAFQKAEESLVYFTKAKSELEAMLPKVQNKTA